MWVACYNEECPEFEVPKFLSEGPQPNEIMCGICGNDTLEAEEPEGGPPIPEGAFKRAFEQIPPPDPIPDLARRFPRKRGS